VQRLRSKLGSIRRRLWLVRVFVAGAGDRVQELWFLFRHPTSAAFPPTANSMQENLARAIREGIDYLARTQRADGLWRAFVMEPGVSTEWITAHVLFVLEDAVLPGGVSPGEVLPGGEGNGQGIHLMCARAARGLLSNGRRRGGWAFSHRFGVDTDSTAQGIMALQRYGYELAPAWGERLLAAQHQDGGFSTYAVRHTTPLDSSPLDSSPPPRSNPPAPRTWWEMPHADVTLMAVEALRRLDLAEQQRPPTELRGGANVWPSTEQQRHRATDWLASQLKDDVLPAYWWPNPAYSLWAQARTGFNLAATAARAGAARARATF
jgi:hypothetical protein